MSTVTIQQAFELALQHHQAGRLSDAESIYRQILNVQPEHAGAIHYLGTIARQVGRLDIAEELMQRSIQLNPSDASFYNNFGEMLSARGKLDKAVNAYRRSIAIEPTLAEAHNNLGNALSDLGKPEEALAAYRQAVTLKPGYAEATSNIGNHFKYNGQLEEAIAHYRQALAFNPNLVYVYNNLGNALSDKGLINESLDAFQKAITLAPGFTVAHSNLLLTLHYHLDYGPAAIAEACREWNRQHAAGLKPLQKPHSNRRDPERKLRIGYCSPDFREHPVGRFLMPLIECHDRTQFELFGYAQVTNAGAVTERFRSLMDHWRSTMGLSDQQLADQIREDGIDILVDLAMHTSSNRLLVFAQKPAPVQVSYLAYCSTTGLDAMDYRLSDPYLDPADRDETVYCEKTVRLAETYWCYDTPASSPAVNAPPAVAKGRITFGSLNNFRKMNEATLSLWASLLRAVPQSELLLHAHEGSHREWVVEELSRLGVESSRVDFRGHQPGNAYFELYHAIDIALDTFPYCGGTTTCDALWMGVPVITLAGERAVSRAGVSLLSNVGHPELIAQTEQDYLRIATELAADLPRLTELRSTLRERMQASPLMNAQAFAKNVEAAYREMWRNWCSTPAST